MIREWSVNQLFLPSVARQGGLDLDSEVANGSDNPATESPTDMDDTDAGIGVIKG